MVLKLGIMLLLALVALPLACSRDEAGAANLECGAVIREDTTLGHDMECGEMLAVQIVEGGVTFDLDGHTISGPGPGRRSWPVPEFDVVGVAVEGDDVTILNGTITGFGTSLLLQNAGGATVEGIVTTGSYYGLYLTGGGNHQVHDSEIDGNVYGVTLFESNGNILQDNLFARQTHFSPGGYGIYLSRSTCNLIERNTIGDNINWGLWFSDSSGNTVVRNNIIGNDPQVSDDSGGNAWFDEGSREGNYWSDYQGSDGNGDGIGDLPYTIGGPGRSADVYPFVAPDGWQDRAATTIDIPTPEIDEPSNPLAFIPLADGSVAVVDPASGALRASWDIGVTDGDLAVSLDGRTVYAIAGGAVKAIDAESGETIGKYVVPGAVNLAATYDGARLVISTEDGFTEVLLDSGELRDQPESSDAVAILPSWKHNLVLVATEARTVNVLYLPGQHVPYALPLDASPLQVVDNRAGTRMYAVLKGITVVQVYETEHFQLADEIPLGDTLSTDTRIAPSPDGSTLYLLDRATSTIRATDLATKTATSSAGVDGEAVDVDVTGNGGYVIVTVEDGDAGRAVILNRDLQPLGAVDLQALPVGLATPR